MAAGGDASQEWDSDRYVAHAPFVPLVGQSVIDLVNPQSGGRILDVGCGDGVLSEKIREAGAIVVGVDDAPDMVEAARRRGIDARVIDACNMTFKAEFDAVFPMLRCTGCGAIQTLS